MTMVAAMPIRWAWYATAWAWLPAETASTPAGALGGGELRHLVERAPLLERGGELQVLELQEHLAAADGREGARFEAGGLADLAAQPRGRALDVGGQRRVGGGAHGGILAPPSADTSRHRVDAQMRPFVGRSRRRVPSVAFRRVSPWSRGGERRAARSTVAPRGNRRACSKAIMSKKLVSSLAALALASFCGLAQADDVSFTGFAHGSQTVTATLSAPNAALVQVGIGRRLHHDPERRPVVRELLRRPVPDHRLRRAAVHRVRLRRPGPRVHERQRLRRPRPALRHRRAW